MRGRKERIGVGVGVCNSYSSYMAAHKQFFVLTCAGEGLAFCCVVAHLQIFF